MPGVLLAAVLAVLARLPFIGRPAFPDEAGLLLVARQWHGGGSALYGDLWIDRPPLLVSFWSLADVLGGVTAGRLLGCLFVAATVVGAGWAGWLVGQRRGAYWAAGSTAAFLGSPLMATNAINGELLAAPFVMVSCALTLTAVRRMWSVRTEAGLAVLAGVVGACALLIKQNFVDALIFAVVLLIVAGVRNDIGWPRVRRILAWGAVGALVPVVVTVGWALTTGHGVTDLWYALYGFRSDAMSTIASESFSAPAERLVRLIGVAVISGLVLLSVRYATVFARAFRGDAALALATAAMLTYGYVSVLMGGSFWLHYLIGLVPAVALAAAQIGARSGGHVLSRAALAVVVASAVVTPVAGVASGAMADDPTETAVKKYLRDSRRSTDSAVIAYGHANVLEASGIEPGYRFLWSLPMRVLDPDLAGLTRKLSGPRAPTWFLGWEPLNSWEIDEQGQLSAAIKRNYREVAQICDVEIYLLKRDDRIPPPEPVVDCPDP
ncbi:hypothetical protein MU582_00110 [Nocardioidaceae bacterium SCSIO 66511]|nr:hypothetical protein MU582_00110 [Nocardioidaceae bacterium SCSIO 66511]